MKTIECAEVTWRKASAVRSGKPITTPDETMAGDKLRCARPFLAQADYQRDSEEAGDGGAQKG